VATKFVLDARPNVVHVRYRGSPVRLYCGKRLEPLVFDGKRVRDGTVPIAARELANCKSCLAASSASGVKVWLLYGKFRRARVLKSSV